MSRSRAVLLDGMGTLVRLEDPAPALQAELESRFGVRIGRALAERALREEIACYRAHHLDGRDAAGLAGLRERCTEALRAGLGREAQALPAAQLQRALLAALRFSAFPDSAPALARLRASGARLVVVSNWDCSLSDVLSRVGLRTLVDGVVTSAEAGVAKPAPAIFAHALSVAGVDAPNAVHVGDSAHEDVEGARAAGIEAVLIARARAPSSATVRTIGCLDEL